jgi:hypothetical protein
VLPAPSSISPVGFAFLFLMGVLLLAVPRRTATAPVLALVCFMTLGEHLILGGLNFTMVRILLLFGWLRIFFKREFQGLSFTSVDKLIVGWVILRTINYTLVWGTSAALINRLGYAYDIIGSYFLFRCLIRTPEDLYRSIRFLAMFIGPLAILMAQEKLTGQNPFAIVGGTAFSEVRDGVVRTQGPFLHSILAGSFGAGAFVLFVGAWLYRRTSNVLIIVALASSIAITAFSGSSGPALAWLAGVVALALWPFRRRMRLIRWSAVATLLGLQVVMNSPIWFVMARLTVFSGSTGWFRGFLIDTTIRHFDEWWLIGSNRNAEWHWFLADVTNQYIAEALGGGLLAMILFIAILANSFRAVGQIVLSRRVSPNLKPFAWALGAALFSHSLSFFSVTYFDQNVIVYYMLLAGIGTLKQVQVAPAGARRASPAPPAPMPQYPVPELSR